MARYLCAAQEPGGGAGSGPSLPIEGLQGSQGHQVVQVEPMWVGSEPYFRVEVIVQPQRETQTRSLSVRAREGCVDRELTEPSGGAQPLKPEEISL